MAQSPYLSEISSEFQPELTDIQRKQKLAELLMQRGMQQPQGQMVGGRFVAPSMAERLAGLFNVYSGRNLQETTEERQKALAEQLRQQKTKGLQEFMASSEARPEETVYGAGKEGPTMTYQPARPAVPYGQRVATLSQTNPELGNMLMADLLKTHNVAKGGTLQRGNLAGSFETVASGLPELPDAVDAAVAFLGLQGKNPKDWSPEERRAVESKALDYKRSGATNVSVNTGQKGFDNTLKLRTDFRSEPTYKAFQEVDSAHRQITEGLNSKSPAGDLAAATKFMKLLDPGSVVRESELNMAMQSTGKLDQAKTYAQSIINGTKLSEKQRADFRNMSNDLFNAAANQYSSKQAEYAGIAKRNDLNIEDVVGSAPKLKESTRTKVIPTTVPKGVNPALWNVMTDEQKALWGQ
jgi:hypothetical protein